MFRFLERIRMVPVILVMGTIFSLSHTPGSEIDLSLFKGVDKLLHAAVFGLLCATALFAHRWQLHLERPLLVIGSSAAFSIIFAISDEYHQSFIPGRMVSLGDIAADIFGMSCVLLLYWWGRPLLLSYLVELEKK